MINNGENYSRHIVFEIIISSNIVYFIRFRYKKKKQKNILPDEKIIKSSRTDPYYFYDS